MPGRSTAWSRNQVEPAHMVRPGDVATSSEGERCQVVSRTGGVGGTPRYYVRLLREPGRRQTMTDRVWREYRRTYIVPKGEGLVVRSIRKVHITNEETHRRAAAFEASR